MRVKEYLTTDNFIERINQLPEVFAVKNDMYGIDIYASYDEYRDDDKNFRWFMTVDPGATSTYQPYDVNFHGWPEEWEEKLGEVAAIELKTHVADLIVAYINTPLEFRLDDHFNMKDTLRLTKAEKILYDFFIAVGQPMNSIDYPLAILNIWTSGDEGAVTTDYICKDEVINAYGKPGVMDKPLYLAIKEIKGWI